MDIWKDAEHLIIRSLENTVLCQTNLKACLVNTFKNSRVTAMIGEEGICVTKVMIQGQYKLFVPHMK